MSISKRVKVLSLSVPVVIVFFIGAGWWFYWPTYLGQNKVRGVLLDPDSAKFSKVKFFRSTGSTCGYVNSKNKMGGYVGDTQFLVTGSGEVSFLPSVSRERPEAPELSGHIGGDPFAAASRIMAANSRYQARANAYIAELDKQIAFLEEVQKNCPDSEPKEK